MAKKHLYALLAVFAVTGCASTTTVIPTSNSRLQALPATQDIPVFLQESEVKVPFTVVGLIQHSNPGKYQRLTLDDAIPVLQGEARSLGGNGVVVDRHERIISGTISRGIEVSARAIRF